MAGVTEIRGDITGITNACPGKVTSASHGLPQGSIVRITDVEGMDLINDMRFRVFNPSANNYELQDPATHDPFDTSNFGMYESGGEWNRIDRAGEDRVIYKS